MRHPIKELPLVEDYGEGFRSRLVEWGGMRCREKKTREQISQCRAATFSG